MPEALPLPDGRGIGADLRRLFIQRQTEPPGELPDPFREGPGFRAGITAEESKHSGQRPEARDGLPCLPVPDRLGIDPDPQRNLPLQEPKVQAAFSDMIPSWTGVPACEVDVRFTMERICFTTGCQVS